MILMNIYGEKRLLPYITVGIAFWLCFIHSGIHPTIAGVLFALVVPMKPRIRTPFFSKRASTALEKLQETNLEENDPLTDAHQEEALEKMWKDAKRSLPALLRLENSLTKFNAHIVIPLFAFANAGVALQGQVGDAISGSLGLGIILGLVVGKAVGITLFSWLGYKLNLASLPDQLRWSQIIGLSFMAGIGFTMSLFITNLAFDSMAFREVSKISILTASLIAAILGVVVLLIWGQKRRRPVKEIE
jgi:NhaA family Na+:H+ antiporter